MELQEQEIQWVEDVPTTEDSELPLVGTTGACFLPTRYASVGSASLVIVT